MILKGALVFLIIFPDTLSKYLASTYEGSFSILGDWLQIVSTRNTGIAFGTELPGILFIIPLVLLGIIIYTVKNWKQFSPMEQIGLLCILTGGTMNALERSLFGHVTDFIALKYFAVFNVADIAITAGVILLLFSSIKGKKVKGKKAKK